MMDSQTPPKTPDPVTADRPVKPWQFRLWHLLALTTVVCIVGATYQWLGPAAALSLGVLLVFGLAVIAIAEKTIIELLVVLAIIGVLLALLLPRTPQWPRGTRSTCSNNLKQIVMALHNYHDVYGTFPPAYIADKSGRPMHSWRVLILPFLEQKPLYDLYRFDELWDGPNNAKLGAQLLKLYACPSDPDAETDTHTSYVAIVGNGTVWPGEKAIKLSDLKDGPSNTLLVVEVHNSGIHWMEPRDLHIGQMPLAINPPRGQGMSSKHPKGAQAAFADGHVQFIPDSTPPETIRGLLTIAGDEAVKVP